MSDKRLKDFINPKNEIQNTAVHLIRFPSDEGVKRNGGRPGAAKAPDLILDQLLNLTPHPAYYQRHIDLLSTVSFGDPVTCSGNVEADQATLGKMVGDVFKNNILPVIIGGGHETSYGHFLGYVEANKPVSILNIDAHTDVRPLKDGSAHSGSPFRQALEHPSRLCISYNVFGLNPSSVSLEHYNYVNENGKAVFRSDVNSTMIQNFLDHVNPEAVMATIDMDVVCQSEAPGVSAPNSAGITGSVGLKCAFELGKNPAVRSLDLCEVNPVYDRDNQTIKLAAHAIWYFLLGLSFR